MRFALGRLPVLSREAARPSALLAWEHYSHSTHNNPTTYISNTPTVRTAETRRRRRPAAVCTTPSHRSIPPQTDPALLLTTLRRYLAAGVVVRSRSETKSRQPLRTSPLACLTVLLLSGLLDTYAAAAGIRVLRNDTTRHDTTRHDETRHDTQHLSTPPTRRQDDRTHRRSELHVHGDCITHTPDPWQCRGALEAYCLLCTTKKVGWPRRLRCL